MSSFILTMKELESLPYLQIWVEVYKVCWVNIQKLTKTREVVQYFRKIFTLLKSVEMLRNGWENLRVCDLFSHNDHSQQIKQITGNSFPKIGRRVPCDLSVSSAGCSLRLQDIFLAQFQPGHAGQLREAERRILNIFRNYISPHISAGTQ